MLAFAIRRLFEAAIVMVTVALIAFTLFRFVGDPVNQMVGQDTSLEDRLRLREELGLNDPIPVQFARFLTSAAQFDFGISYQMKQPVTAIIRDRFPATLELALTAALFAVALLPETALDPRPAIAQANANVDHRSGLGLWLRLHTALLQMLPRILRHSATR